MNYGVLHITTCGTNSFPFKNKIAYYLYSRQADVFFFFLSMKKKTIRLTRVRIDIIVERTIRNAGVHHVPADEGVCLHFRSVRIRFSTEIFASFMI
jgi:hypothetical protein